MRLLFRIATSCALLTLIVIANSALAKPTGRALPGMSSLGLRNNDGSSWVVAFNSLPKDRGAFASEYDRQLQTARARMRGWPSGNLFPQFP